MTGPHRPSSNTQRLEPVPCPMCDGDGCDECDFEGKVPLGRFTELEFKKAKRSNPPDTDRDPPKGAA